MAIGTQQSVSGFIATEPQLTYGDAGVARFYARFGQEHFRREDDGTFTQLEPTFHTLVMYRKTAERAAEAFTKGDRFLAEGYVNTYTYEKDGRQLGGEEFVAKKIGHDTARTSYTINRTPTPAQQSMAAETPGREFTTQQRTTAPAAAAIGQ